MYKKTISIMLALLVLAGCSEKVYLTGDYVYYCSDKNILEQILKLENNYDANYSIQAASRKKLQIAFNTGVCKVGELLQENHYVVEKRWSTEKHGDIFEVSVDKETMFFPSVFFAVEENKKSSYKKTNMRIVALGNGFGIIYADLDPMYPKDKNSKHSNEISLISRETPKNIDSVLYENLKKVIKSNGFLKTIEIIEKNAKEDDHYYKLLGDIYRFGHFISKPNKKSEYFYGEIKNLIDKNTISQSKYYDPKIRAGEWLVGTWYCRGDFPADFHVYTKSGKYKNIRDDYYINRSKGPVWSIIGDGTYKFTSRSRGRNSESYPYQIKQKYKWKTSDNNWRNSYTSLDLVSITKDKKLFNFIDGDNGRDRACMKSSKYKDVHREFE